MKKSISRRGLEMMLGTALVLSGFKFMYNSFTDYPKLLPTPMITVGEESYLYAIESEKNFQENNRLIENYKRKNYLTNLIGIPEVIFGLGIIINLNKKYLTK